MLIVAIPKSASTSLLETLGQLHGRKAVQTNFFDLPIHPDYQPLAQLHWDQHELTPEIVETLVDPSRFCKNHVVPTAHNQALLERHPKVVLLREPSEIIGAYRRAVHAADVDLEQLNRSFDGCDSESDWLARAAEIGLLGSLEKFYSGWQDHQGDKLIVQYADLIAEPRAAVNEIEAYFSLPRSEHVELVRTRYTRTPVKNALRRALKRLGLLDPVQSLYRKVRSR